MTIEQAQIDFDELIAKNGFTLAGRTSDTGTPLYHTVRAKYTNLEQLDAEVIRTFVEKVIVYEREPGKKRRGVRLKIIYNCIGEIKIAKPPEKTT